MLRRFEEKTQVKLLESFFTPGIKKKKLVKSKVGRSD